MSIRAIHFRDGQFCNESSSGVGPAAIGKDIVRSLLSGTEVTEFGVTANYAVEMLRYVGRTGEFYDSTDWLSGDHDFDPNTPTPGHNWASASSQRRDASVLKDLLADLRKPGNRTSFNSFLASATAQMLESLELLDEAPAVTRPFRDSVQLPTLKCGGADVGTAAIWYDARAEVFNFGCVQLGPNKLGRLIANALMRGEEKVNIGGFQVTVNYLVQMCRLTGRFGRFVNYNDDLFDGNVPPSGGYREFTDFAVNECRDEGCATCWSSLR